MTREEREKNFISFCKRKYGDKFDYSKVHYTNNRTKVTITCRKHGDFEQYPDHFKRGVACQKCSFENQAKEQSMGLDDFI
ncbi:hypothetical protein [Vibrio phage vB_pir03]|nr:hypothetical protein [Vibrio phage vB_pir03]